jgi:hypothetical protein
MGVAPLVLARDIQLGAHNSVALAIEALLLARISHKCDPLQEGRAMFRHHGDTEVLHEIQEGFFVIIGLHLEMPGIPSRHDRKNIYQ